MARQRRLIIGKNIAMMILQLITEKSEIGNAETLFVAKCGITGELALSRAIIVIVIVITFYSPSCLRQETAKGPFGLRVKLPHARLSTTHSGGFILSL